MNEDFVGQRRYGNVTEGAERDGFDQSRRSTIRGERAVPEAFGADHAKAVARGIWTGKWIKITWRPDVAARDVTIQNTA